jgi:hypothetical protein
MQSLSRGWSFLTEAWKMALADKDLIKPSIYALFAGIFVSIIGIIPIGLGVLVLQSSQSLIAQAIVAILGAGLIFLHYSVGYIFSGMTIYLIYGYLSEGDGRMDKAWAVVQREWLNILSLAVASTVVNMLQSAVRGRGRNRNMGRSLIADLINSVWTEATYLVLPAMVIEGLNLKDGLKRATYIAKNNLLLIGVSMVGVRAITGIIGFVLGAIGVVLGLAVGYPIIALANGALVGIFIGVGLGVILASIFILTATVISSYMTTAYHTCLFLWARDVERAQTAGHQVQIAAPAPLAAVLGS